MAFWHLSRQRYKSASIAVFAMLALTWLVFNAKFCAGVAAAERDALAALEARYRRATALEANFLERYRENGKEVRVEAGRAYFLRPGKMRWEYEKPEKNLFLVDGKYVWFYAPDDHTATRMPAKQSDDWRTPIAFLTTGMKLGASVLKWGRRRRSRRRKRATKFIGVYCAEPSRRKGRRRKRCCLKL